MLVNQPSAMPNRKVTWATFAALLSSIAANIIVDALPIMGSVDPAELELLIETALIGLSTFITGYMVRDRV